MTRRYFLGATLAAVFLFLTVGAVFAWVDTGPFCCNPNYWDPNTGDKWAQFAVVPGSRYLHADASPVSWDSGRTAQIQADLYDPMAVFHIFQQNTNCGQQFNFTGYWWSNIAGTFNNYKWAFCAGQPTTGPNNELRIVYPRLNIVANTAYDVGGEFVDQGGGALSGETNYDTYYITAKDNHGKWCFDGNNNIWAPGPSGC